MSDPRIDTVLTVLREAGATTNLDDTDTLATKIVNALDREHGTSEADAGATGGGALSGEDAPEAAAGNPETPVGTGHEGGGDNAGQ